MTALEFKPGRFGDEREPWWFVVDPLIIASVGLITAVGSLLVYSATRGPVTDVTSADTSFLERQLVFAFIGAGLALVAALIDVRRIRAMIGITYGGFIFLLVALKLFGAEINGAQAWFRFNGFTFQPSEPGKLVLIVALAAALSHKEVGVRRMLTAVLMAVLPIFLILLQPDLGTVLIYVVVTAVMMMMSNIRLWLIGSLVLAAITVVVLIFTSDVLEQYQTDRLTVFILDEEGVDALGVDAQRVAYNAEQSQIAIGNGGLFGQGLFQGTQTNSNLVPAQQTDFIFSVAGEELGFRGASILLGLFALLIFRIWRTAVRATDDFDRLISVGVMAMFVIQVFQSAGMTMGIMPVTGIPMPFVSYGGSSMLTSMMAIGLVLGVHRRRFDYATRT